MKALSEVVIDKVVPAKFPGELMAWIADKLTELKEQTARAVWWPDFSNAQFERYASLSALELQVLKVKLDPLGIGINRVYDTPSEDGKIRFMFHLCVKKRQSISWLSQASSTIMEGQKGNTHANRVFAAGNSRLLTRTSWYQAFMAKLKFSQQLLAQVEAVRPGIRAQKAMVATISKEWPQWDWTIPSHRTPPFWAERRLSQLRWISLRYEWSKDFPKELAAICTARLKATSGGGVPASHTLKPCDVVQLRTQLMAEGIIQEQAGWSRRSRSRSSSRSVEQDRGQELERPDLSSSFPVDPSSFVAPIVNPAPTLQAARFLNLDDVEAAMQNWDAVNLETFVKRFHLEIVAAESANPLKPRLQVWTRILQ